MPEVGYVRQGFAVYEKEVTNEAREEDGTLNLESLNMYVGKGCMLVVLDHETFDHAYLDSRVLTRFMFLLHFCSVAQTERWLCLRARG